MTTKEHFISECALAKVVLAPTGPALLINGIVLEVISAYQPGQPGEELFDVEWLATALRRGGPSTKWPKASTTSNNLAASQVNNFDPYK